jgi:hypothetical protein
MVGGRNPADRTPPAVPSRDRPPRSGERADVPRGYSPLRRRAVVTVQTLCHRACHDACCPEMSRSVWPSLLAVVRSALRSQRSGLRRRHVDKALSSANARGEADAQPGGWRIGTPLAFVDRVGRSAATASRTPTDYQAMGGGSGEEAACAAFSPLFSGRLAGRA